MFLAFSWGFEVFEAHFLTKKIFLYKKGVVVVGGGEKPKKHRREWCLASLLTGEIAIRGDSDTP